MNDTQNNEKIVIKPQGMPRDVTDVLLCAVALTIGLCLGAVVAWLPVAMGLLISHGRKIYLLVPALIASTAGLSILLGVLLICVWRLELTPQGMRFIRFFGKPRFLRWTDIAAINKADRWEVVFKGWLVPPFPPREATTALTSLDTYKIQYGSEYRYFPPKDPEAFEAAVLKFSGKLPGAASNLELS